MVLPASTSLRSTSTGTALSAMTALSVMEPSPSWPNWLLPQAARVPSEQSTTL